MAEQNYKNYVRYYTPHHFIFYPVTLGLLTVSVWCFFQDQGNKALWASIAALWAVMIWLAFMLRQHYALTLQDRIVRLELRFRYFTLTQQRLEPMEARLSFDQLKALRFASDEELPELIRQTVEKQLSPGQITKSIRNWIPDHNRV